jgi:thiosulfate dehydrogenase (quinone) large subunit
LYFAQRGHYHFAAAPPFRVAPKFLEYNPEQLADPMRVLIRRILFTTVLLTCLVYGGDYVSLQLQIPDHRAQFGTVMVQRDNAVPLKNRSTEYMFDQPVPVTCVYSLFPHFGYPPCWYVSRHTRQEIKMGGLFAPTMSYDRIGAMMSDSIATPSSDTIIAYSILRLSFGVNIMLHGASRMLAGLSAFTIYLSHYFEHTPLMPKGFLPVFGAVLPPVEAALGALLLLGLFTRVALIAGGLVMTILVFGTNLAQDWNVAGLQLIYCVIYYYLLAHRREGNLLSVDAWLLRK